ncbi:hypothetical protein GGR44_000444 [Sphingobium fontiphilum]|uniref:Uncharacterized protein n=1 Tax=Sphingobium fontiphilum TaxID=944425 RepID=A0A7W6DCT1_9SPHN|nr:hypothetical protein [Sphingobium fontiphilum]MBB3980813.1 hypothetical protein [Sphingobium fontiphilum]
MTEPHDPPATFVDKLRERAGVIVAVIGLIAWMAMLWFMFGDVL